MRYARIAHLAPGYFALVMAMGILSVAAADEGLPGISAAWLWVAVAAYAVLVGLNVARIARFRSSVAEDLANPSRSFEFFAFVAATCVLGTRSAVGRTLAPALALWLMGLVGWVCLWVGTAAWAITAGALVRWMVRGSYPPRERRRRKSRLVLGGTSRMR